MSKRDTATSKFLSFVLRHQPDAIGLMLDAEGWASITELIAGARATGREIDEALIHHVVEHNDKKRFAISDDGLRIRAVQGHSTHHVDIAFEARQPPAVLYHGTAARFLDAILEQGLKPGTRQYVHLSEDTQTATSVGQRYGKPVVMEIDARAMHAQGHTFFRAENGVWLTDGVPTTFLRVTSGWHAGER